ncbi:MAG: aldehyde dehydrogenase family protein [Myxococcales bacterium]|nr:aldehyde dehydrogenase family protein [Myxococcales bacterium]
MAIVQPIEPTSDGRRRLSLRSPIGRAPIDEITVMNAGEVQEAIARAREAQRLWGARSPEERARIVGRALDVLLRRQEDVIATVRRETGKTRVDALAIEIISSCDFINYWTGRAPKDLADEKRKMHGYLKPLRKLVIQYQPLGVVGVITPWNGPFVLSMNACVQALLAGNAVLLKPSEVTPRSGGLAGEILIEAGVPEGVIQVLHGDGETGAALVSGGVDKIAFTGSVATGRKIAVACAEQLIPYTLELGGKDPMIVCEDANLERAAAGAVYLSMFNTGQVCLAVERVYAVESIADALIEKIREKVEALRYGPGDDTDLGAIFWDRQLEIIDRQVQDAREKGAKVLTGGKPALTDEGLFYPPTLLTDVTHDMDVMREETFGPVLAVMRVKDEDEAIRLANDSKYGLSASVFTTDDDKALRIARQLVSGTVMQNDAATIYGVPEAPFGGRKHSGVGQVNGQQGVRSYAYAHPVVLDRWKLDREDIWFPLTERTTKTLEKTIEIAFSRPLRRLMR